MNRQELSDLVEHMTWADALTWRSIDRVPGVRTDARLMYLMHHIHTVHWVYLQAWRNDPFVVTELKSYENLDAIRSWGEPFYALAKAFAGTMDDALLARPLDFPWSKMIAERYGTVRPATLSESAWQVASHTTYHRGQVATRVRELGGEPPLVDFLVWVWSGKPAAEWT
jgi:uncharacterized damage-inducible protein DinB